MTGDSGMLYCWQRRRLGSPCALPFAGTMGEVMRRPPFGTPPDFIGSLTCASLLSLRSDACLVGQTNGSRIGLTR
jgi:hypothetical protein